MLRFLAIIALILFAGSTAAARTAEEAPPSLADACPGYSGNDLAARALWLRTYDHVRLYAIEGGSSKTAIVLAHGGGGSVCETLGVATKLVANGYRVVAFDFRGYARSQSSRKRPFDFARDLAAASSHARRTGAQRVFLMGSSMGGAAIVQNTSSLRVDGRISLSGTRLWPGYGVNNPRSLPRIRAPFLYVGTRSDPRAPLKEALSIFRRIGARDKRTALYRGTDHGWPLLETSSLGPQRLALVLRWIAARSA